MPSPEEIQAAFEDEDISRMEVMTLMSRWLTGSHAGAFCSYPLPYGDQDFLPDPEEMGVQLNYINLFGDEDKEVILQLNRGDYRSQVFILYPSAEEWTTYSEYLDFNTMGGYTSCLYCMDNKGYATLTPLQLCDGSYYLEAMICGGQCGAGSGRGDDVTRDLYHITDNGFWSVFSDQLEDAYAYDSPCPDATSPPEHTDFEYLKKPGDEWPSQVKLTHHLYELILPRKKRDQGECMGGENYKEVSAEEEIIEICE